MLVSEWILVDKSGKYFSEDLNGVIILTDKIENSHKFSAIDKEKLLIPDNFEWKKIVTEYK